jgi:hypothetical protein
MYYRVKILSETKQRFPAKTEYEYINNELGLLFEDAGEKAYDLIEKYVTDAFEYDDPEEFMQNLQTFAKRAEVNEVKFLMAILTDSNWEQLQKSPTLMDSDAMENSAAYWFLNNIISQTVPNIVSPIEAICLKVQVFGNNEYALLGKEDCGKYGEIYPFTARLLMDAYSSKGAIGTYELCGPIVEYFENLKGSKKKSVPSDEAYDFEDFVDDTGGIVLSASVLKDPEDSDDEEVAVYEIIVHPAWLGKEIPSDFETFPYSDYFA